MLGRRTTRVDTMSTAIRFETMIDIDVQQAAAFDFASGISNYPLRRTEVDWMEARVPSRSEWSRSNTRPRSRA